VRVVVYSLAALAWRSGLAREKKKEIRYQAHIIYHRFGVFPSRSEPLFSPRARSTPLYCTEKMEKQNDYLQVHTNLRAKPDLSLFRHGDSTQWLTVASTMAYSRGESPPAPPREWRSGTHSRKRRFRLLSLEMGTHQ
jgi:hypothetical protein